MDKGPKIGSYLRTLRYLKPLQVFWRVRVTVRRRLGWRGVPALRPVEPSAAALTRLAYCLPRLQACCPPDGDDQTALAGGGFAYGAPEPVPGETPPWEGAGQTRLWRFRLHYCGFARAAALSGEDSGRTKALAWLDDWMDRNPPGTDVAWDPYTAARRLLHWPLLLAAADDGCHARRWSSLEQQARWLAANLEHDLQANHLLTERIALAFAEALMPGVCSDAFDRLRDELGRQILDDGGHEERSPMYHALVFQDLLLVHAVLARPPQWLDGCIGRMARFLAGVTLPDGDISLVQDAVLGEAPPARALLALARSIPGIAAAEPEGCVGFRESGFYRMHGDAALTALVFAGPPGPPHQPGHAHGGALGYELALGPKRIVVDSGVHGYAGSPFLAYCRSTRAHNTVVVNGGEQLEHWGPFRVGRRYRPVLHHWRRLRAGQLFAASHDGFAPFTHLRYCLAAADGGFLVLDEISGPGAIEAVSHVHLHPDIVAQPDALGWMLGDSGLFLQPWGCGAGTVLRGEETPQQGWYCPRFGEAVAAPVVALTAEGRDLVRFGYALHRALLPGPELARRLTALPGLAAAEAASHGVPE